jgi:hypothetical protein
MPNGNQSIGMFTSVKLQLKPEATTVAGDKPVGRREGAAREKCLKTVGGGAFPAGIQRATARRVRCNPRDRNVRSSKVERE